MLFSLRNIGYIYPESREHGKSLDGINLEIASGDFISLIGHIGSGKSTLLKLLVGLLKPTEGEILFEGGKFPVKGEELRKLRRRVGIVFQFAEAQAFEATVSDEVRFALHNFDFPQEDTERLIGEALDAVGLPLEEFGGRSPFELSGGERKKLALASILVFQPEMLLLDEPAAGLDSQGRKDLINILNKHKEKGRGAVIVSHDLDLSMELCPRVLILHEGRLVYDGSREILYNIGSLRLWDLTAPELTQAWKRLKENGPAPAQYPYSLIEAKNLLEEYRKKL